MTTGPCATKLPLLCTIPLDLSLLSLSLYHLLTFFLLSATYAYRTEKSHSVRFVLGVRSLWNLSHFQYGRVQQVQLGSITCLSRSRRRDARKMRAASVLAALLHGKWNYNKIQYERIVRVEKWSLIVPCKNTPLATTSWCILRLCVLSSLLSVFLSSLSLLPPPFRPSSHSFSLCLGSSGRTRHRTL